MDSDNKTDEFDEEYSTKPNWFNESVICLFFVFILQLFIFSPKTFERIGIGTDFPIPISIGNLSWLPEGHRA